MDKDISPDMSGTSKEKDQEAEAVSHRASIASRSTTGSSPSLNGHASPVICHYEEPRDEVFGDVLTPHISRISHISTKPPGLKRFATGKSGVSVLTNATTDPAYEVSWEEGRDDDDPRNWSLWYKGWVLFALSFATTTV